jgi:hypothetical protein
MHNCSLAIYALPLSYAFHCVQKWPCLVDNTGGKFFLKDEIIQRYLLKEGIS